MSRLRAAATALTLSACAPHLVQYRGYHGDGSFKAQPASTLMCQDGYTVDLGTIDLTRQGRYVLRLEGLPALGASIGVALNASQRGAEVPPANALIEMTLRDDKDHIILSRHERLSEWMRSFASNDPAHAFLFQRGTQIEVAVAPRTFRIERFPLGPDDSWGTSFSPRRDVRYTLHFRVEEPDASLATVEARLQVRGLAACLQ